eukprot:CAMPEP_0198592078 /NCGR_PEP_ID=MMETSP1462-20131121/137684_1 /TAXON_ID=1333877 /ORGANISM="Brandtodinium nutriculum, Strain RCC3387" /LENGTH=303 /DNA_ID=CAMNT_0044323653 /DNA_START=1 /DNA_END=912 /DNA_ORIENTATION=+
MALVSDDALLAHALARRQEQADADLAKRLSEAAQVEDDAALARRLAAAAGGAGPAPESPAPGGLAASGMRALYVPCEVGAHVVEILVDTGAEMSVISESLARQLDLLGQLDARYRGTARGVGSASILGKIFGVPVKLGHVEFELDFSVLQTDNCQLILGLDQMRRCRCLIDLEKGALVFGGAGGVEVPFLASAGGGRAPISAPLAGGHRAAEALRVRDPNAAPVVFQTVGRLLRNILAHPADARYRRLRSSSLRLQREVFAHPEAVELLHLAGFVAEGTDLMLPSEAPLQPLKQLLAASFLRA